MRATITDPHRKLPPILFKRHLIVRRAPVDTAGVEMSKTKEIKNCCSTIGTTTFSCFFEKTAYDPSGKATVIANVDNSKMDKEAEGLVIKLKRNIEGHAGHHHFHQEDKLSRRQYPGVDKNKQEERTLELHLNEIAQQSRQTLNRKRKKKGEYSNEDVALAELMQPSVYTRLVRCEYILEVKLDFTGCCAADPTLRLPLIIFAPSINRVMPQNI
jgi:hypothetical protein